MFFVPLIAPRLDMLIIACTPRASRQPDKEKPHMLHKPFLSGNRYCPLYLVPCFVYRARLSAALSSIGDTNHLYEFYYT